MIADYDTGEILDYKFMKMYFRDIGKLFGLSGIGYSTLMLMARSIGLGNRGSINMTARRKKEFAEKLGCTVRQINNQLKVMIENDVAKIMEPEEYPNEYTINPNIVFSGNDYQRAKLIIDYSSGERNVVAFNGADSAIEYLSEIKDGEQNG